MADFVAVLRKTIGGLGETSPEIRQKVYAKARDTIAAKLAAIDPPPPAVVIERQNKALEDAIAVVEADYASSEAPDAGHDDLEDVFASLSASAPIAAAAPHRPAPEAPSEEGHEPYPDRPADHVEAPSGAGEADAHNPSAHDPATEARSGTDAAPIPPRAPRKRSRAGAGLIAACAALVLIAGAGYGVWLNRDAFLAGPGAGPETLLAAEEAEEAEDIAPPVSAAEPEEAAQDEQIAALDEGAAADEPVPPVSAGQPAPVEKFTQRLTADGSEVEEGPAGGTPSFGEGTSVAAATALADDEEDVPGAEAPPTDAVEGGLQIGQRAIFYEEQTSSSQGSDNEGTIVWSLVQDSPGGDLPPEPAIRAEATIPAKDVQLRMTIRRNGDQSLPASHIIEMIFLTAENFEGGGIDNVLRIALKDSEQAPGSPLIGIPARIADGFFLVALSNSGAEIEANMTLLRRQSWIDIPIIYRSGRRALITMEKGIPGERVFEEAMRAWQEASSG